jgi:hypothetical protein
MNTNNYLKYFAFSTLIIIGLTSCSSSRKSYDSYEVVAQNTNRSKVEYAQLESDLITDKYKGDAENKKQRIRKMIYEAQLTFEVDSIKPSKVLTEQVMTTYNGYLLQSNNTSIRMRVPAKDLKNVLADLKKIGKLTYENIGGQDVTDNYYDFQLRLENAEKTRNRYLELLAQAKSVSEILKVEKELERVNGLIESYKGTIKSYNQQIDYSLVTVYFNTKADKTRPGPLGYVFVGLYKAVKWLFVWN